MADQDKRPKARRYGELFFISDIGPVMSNEETKPDILSRITQTITYKDYITNKEVCNKIQKWRAFYI